jgi:hypothetical protein
MIIIFSSNAFLVRDATLNFNEAHPPEFFMNAVIHNLKSNFTSCTIVIFRQIEGRNYIIIFTKVEITMSFQIIWVCLDPVCKQI